MKPKKELIRVVRDQQGLVSVDLTGKANGRGCYICPKQECFNKAIKAKRIQSALETEIGDAIINTILEKIIENGQ